MIKPILAALTLVLPIAWEDRAVPDKADHLAEVATAVAKVSRSPNEAAFLLTWGRYESAFSIRIQEGRCRLEKGECDATRGADGKLYARARGPWQNHQNRMPAERWAKMIGRENIDVQADEAMKRARWAVATCKGDIRGAFALLGGRGCKGTIEGLNERVRTFEKVKARLR